jgi:FkbM family methyltransferase
MVYRPTRVWIDVGAHHGEHSFGEAKADTALVVYAFEPLPELHAALMRKWCPSFVPIRKAVSEVDGEAVFRVNAFDAASSLLPMDDTARASWTDGHLLKEDREITVETTRLDTFMNGVGIGAVEFLKVDAQGADLSVVRSLGERLRDVGRIQMEVCVTGRQLYRGAADKESTLAFMAGHGFALEATQLQSHGQEENLTFARR